VSAARVKRSIAWSIEADGRDNRVTSNASIASHSSAFPPSSTSEPNFAASRFSYSKQAPSDAPADSSEPYNFIPEVSFDDFANSLQYEPVLSNFPSPPDSSHGASMPPAAAHMTSQSQSQRMVKPTGLAASMNAPPAFSSSTASTAATDSRPARSTSLLRRFSQSRNNAAPGPPENASIPPPTTNMSIRTRRQSQFPAQAPPNPAARAPRKSVGPGMLPTPSLDTRQEAPKLSNDNPQTRIGRTPSFGQGNRRGTLPANVHMAPDAPRVPNAARSAKAKSLHAPPRMPPSLLNTSFNASIGSDHASTPVNQARSPGRPAEGSQTPSSSSSKRQSTMHHVSGLGARTISPTDARRLKRLSMAPNMPGGPTSPPTPQADFSFDEQIFNQSPAVLFRKSVTPSSARGTPDQNRKSYASGISLSSNSSVNSLRPANASLQPRANPAFAGSRLPTAKPRNVHSSAGGNEEEEVPPVPAIPKAYESPKDPDQTSFSFSTASRKASESKASHGRTGTEDLSAAEISNISMLGTIPARLETPKKSSGSIRHRRGLTVGSGSGPDKTPTMQQNKKNLQPIRLPPLNLLPLGTPFNNRISSFPAPSAEVDERTTTPPPKRAANKTPSTPMTASKASFFSKSHGQEPHDADQHLRSSSSAFNLRTADSSLHGASAMPIPTLNPSRQIATPFSSNSLPKGGGDFAHSMYSRPSGEYKHSDTEVEMQSMHVQGPRALPKKDVSDSAPTSASTEPETPSSGSSLRRKLSLSGWRRASSKAATHPSQPSQSRSAAQKNQELPPQPPKHGDMPPPRLPASATWSGSLNNSPTPVNRNRPSLDFQRRKTSTATISSESEVDKPHGQKANNSGGVRIPSGTPAQATGPPTTKSSSLLSPMHRMLGSKSSTNMLKARNLDSNLDRDDMAADEEMKKLASKRKDFEHAARDVDDLRKRARPQERVSAAQAIQMVSLNIFERGEIIDYKEVYFCGTKSAKKHVGDLNASTANFGYDDDRGDYNIVFGDHLAYRYEVVDLLGKGSFGQVVRCVDHKTGGLVAIKIIRNKKRFHQQALVEVNILQKIREWVRSPIRS
jgi:dual specificity tyrosine-phosphorylation-regulated kinase 2/3/4